MGRYLKIIGLLVLALALWQTSGTVPTSDGGVSTGDSTDIQAVTAAHSQDGTCFTSPHLHSLAMSRIQRSYTAEYIFSLKDWVDKLARREAVLSLHKEKLYDSTAYYGCKPVCEYYIFTLRRILI